MIPTNDESTRVEPAYTVSEEAAALEYSDGRKHAFGLIYAAFLSGVDWARKNQEKEK